ncbi:CXXC-type zinc finger protein 1-like [Xenia sp. Carnegie-2017]|uniref:CXXC-type zinc finger protein 1-like n=1 Tax=Xenia sp. Carnegie-2017 TaxID=2897299 RepID=UPI001F04777B|nr:CXXC-type zinc finger protein 1-like [Xenia sp. Carnegie-2017]
MESDGTMLDADSQEDTVQADSDETASADETEEVDILSDFVSSDSNLWKNNSDVGASEANESEDTPSATSTYLGDHDYCVTHTASKDSESNSAAGDNNEIETSERDDVQVEASGHESSPKLIVESLNVKQKEQVYCICRKPDIDRFMICCDACDEWYHGSCIGITKKDAKKIKQFFCQFCQEKDHSLETKYKRNYVKSSESYQDTDENDDNRKQTKRSSRKCGACTACQIETDCGKCDYCLDMRKFGGPNKKRQKCRLRQCLNKSLHLNPPDMIWKNDELRQKVRKIRQPKGRDVNDRSDKSMLGTETSNERKESRRKRRLSLWENPTVEEPRQCYGPQCQKRARSNSKYCSHECGVQLAVRRIQEILPGRVKEWRETPCIANEKAQTKLKELKKIQEKTRARLLELDEESKALDQIIERASHLTVINEEDTESEVDSEIETNIYCVTCGIALLPKVALRHMEKCYMKYESFTSFGSNFKSVGNLFCDFYNAQQKTYCKRLRVLCPEHTKETKILPDEVCGCPLSNEKLEETKELCCIAKRTCVRHYCWEKLRRAQIDAARVHQWLKLEEAFELERQTKNAMKQRGGVLGLLLHRTIVHS